MNDQSHLKRQAETDREKARKLRRLTLFVTDQERDLLARIVENEGYGESVRQMLESFVADLTNSIRRGWPWGKQGAQDWLDSHRAGCRMQQECRSKGGKS